MTPFRKFGLGQVTFWAFRHPSPSTVLSRVEVAGRHTMNPSTNHLPGTVPIWKRGEEPLPPGLTEEDRPMLEQQKKWEGYAGMAMESCATKTVLAGGAGE